MRAAVLGRPRLLRRVTSDPSLLADLDLGVRSNGSGTGKEAAVGGGDNLLCFCLRYLVWGETDDDGYQVVEKLITKTRWVGGQDDHDFSNAAVDNNKCRHFQHHHNNNKTKKYQKPVNRKTAAATNTATRTTTHFFV